MAWGSGENPNKTVVLTNDVRVAEQLHKGEVNPDNVELM